MTRLAQRREIIPTNRLALIACAGLVAFLALIQAGFASLGIGVCGRVPNQDLAMAVIDLGIAAVAYFVFLLGAIRLRRNWDVGRMGYGATIVGLLVSGAIMSAVFISQTSCVR